VGWPRILKDLQAGV